MEAEPIRWRADELLSQAGWLGALARRLVDDPGQADDVLQETWLAALRRPPARARALRPWLAAVTRNAARMQHRGEARRRAREEGHGSDGTIATPDELAARLEGQRLLVDALGRLAEPYRTTILLAYFEHVAADEIARRQGIAASTVRWRLKTGIDTLRADLDRRHAGDRRAWASALAPLLRVETDVAAASVALPLQGVLLMQSLLKVGAAAAAVAIVLAVLSLTGVVPLPSFGEREEAPLPVTFQPVARPDEAGARANDTSERAAVASAPVEAAPSVSPPATPAVAVEARFLDENNRPLAGVTFATQPDSTAPPATTRSAPDGRARLQLALDPADGRVALMATAVGRETWTGSAKVGRGETALLGDVVLAPGGDVAGRVIDPQGRPVAQAIVALHGSRVPRSESDLRRRFPFVPAPATRTHTGGDGSFVLAGVPVGFVHIAAGGRGWLTTFSAPIEVAAGQESGGVELVLDPIPRDEVISGSVVDPAGRPAPFARISYRFGSLPGSGSGSLDTDLDGRFELVVMRRLPHDLDAFDRDGRFGGAHAEAVEPGTRALVLQLRVLPQVEIVVRAGDGTPIERFSALAYDPDGTTAGAHSGPGPHAGGRVTLAPPTAHTEVRVDAAGYALGVQGPFDGDPPAELAFVLAPAPSVRGRVIAGDTPLAGTTIAAFARGAGRHEKDGVRVDRDPQEVARASSDAAGEFVLTLREEGNFVLRASADGWAPSELALDAYDPRAGRDGLELALTRGGSIEGRVLAAPGREVAGTIVAFTRGDGFAFTSRVGAEGAFRVDRLTPGRWEVRRSEYEIQPESHALRSWPRGAWDEIPWSCEVREGVVTRFDLALDGAAEAVQLEGLVSVDGGAPGAWTAALSFGELGLAQQGGDAVQLDREGRFALGSTNSGPARLILTAIGGPLDGLRVVEPIELAPGRNAWSLSLRTAQVAVSNVRAAARPEDQIGLVWIGERGAFAVRPLAHDGELTPTMPAGRLILWRANRDDAARDPRTWPALAATEVAPGGSAALRVP